MPHEHYLILARNDMDLILPQQCDILTIGPVAANTDKEAGAWAIRQYPEWHIASDEEIEAWRNLWDT